ncbi:MAG: hypothetical protein ABI650_12070, partial [Dokdonella sp.]
GDTGEDVAYLSSHPSSAQRILAAQRAGEAFLLENPDKFRDVPGYDACAEEGLCGDADDQTCADLEELCEAEADACVDESSELTVCEPASD